MDQNFRIIKCVEPGKSSVKIKDRFAKLTLSSSNKKKAKLPEQEKDRPPMDSRDDTVRSHVSRNLYPDFLTDDDGSEEERELMNRIFRSKTTTKTSDEIGVVVEAPDAPRVQDVPRRRTKSFSQQLAMSDSDETHCSFELGEPPATEQMGKLEVSPSQPQPEPRSSKMFTSSSPTDEKDFPLRQLSSRLSSLEIKDNPRPGTSDERDARLENALRKYKEEKDSALEEKRRHNRFSVMTISSTSTVTSPISFHDAEADTDDGSDVVVISDSDEDDEDDDDDAHYPVSTDHISGVTHDTISDTQRGRLDAFFDNIPTLNSEQGPERIFAPIKEICDLTKSDGTSIPEESIEICESSNESVEVASPIKEVVAPPPSPLKPLVNKSLISTPEIIQKLASPRRKQTPTASKQTQTPKYMAKSPAKPRTPRKTATPRKTPTPRARKKPADEVPEPAEPTLTPPVSSEPVPSSPAPEPAASHDDSSPEFRVEKINISATIKIKLQFNDEMIASFHAAPATDLPRLTESETTTDNLKQRSFRDPQALTFIDATEIGGNSPSKDPSMAENSDELIEQSPPVEAAPDVEELAEMLSSSHIVYTPSPVNSTPRRTKTPPPPSSPDELPPLRLSQSPEKLPPSPEKSLTPVEPPISSPPAPPESPSPVETSPEVVLDETAQRILDELYGDGWKTPAVVKTLKKAATTTRKAVQRVQVVDDSMMDFTKFHKNIRCDLESTRLQEKPPPNAPTAETPRSIFKVPSTERKVVRARKDVETRPASERKPPRKNIAQTPKSNRKQPPPGPVRDSDDLSDSNSDFDASSDESWKDVFSYSSHNSDSDNPLETPRRNRTKKSKKPEATKKNSSKDEIVYLDLSSDQVKVQQVNDSPRANKDEAFQERLKELLQTYKCPDKKKLEPEHNNKKIKRKLFTPRFGDEDESSPVRPERNDLNSLDNDLVKLTAPLPAMFEPINKHLEAVKTGKPIFKLKTPKIGTKKDKENIPANSEPSTPKPLDDVTTPKRTPKTQSRNLVKKCDNSQFDLMETPSNKYGFLQSLDVIVAKAFCHPDALIYRENYRTRKQDLAVKLFDIYNKNIFNGELDVPIVWNKKLLNTAGRCSCSTKLGKRRCRVELSDKVLTSADRLRCTLIHELCHAATWIYSGEHGHGATWKKWARRANAIFPELPKISVCHDYDIDYKYTYKCTLCSAKSHAHSKSKKVENIRCAYCHGAIEVFLNKKDKDGNVLPTPVKEPTGFAKFVKDNYKKFKKPDLKHADVMKVLSSEFAALNVAAGKKAETIE